MSSGPSFGITSFNIEGFRGIKSTSVEGIPADTKWIFLTGKNGGGKTSVLQALFVGLMSEREGNTILETNKFTSNISLNTKDGQTLIIDNGKIAPGYNVFSFIQGGFVRAFMSDPTISEESAGYHVVLRPIVAYGANRTVIQNSQSSDSTEQKYYRSKSLFGTDTALLNIEAEFKSWRYRSDSQELITKDEGTAKLFALRANNLKDLLLRLMPNVCDLGVNILKDKVVYYEIDDFGNSLGIEKSFDQLASGNRSIIGMIGDMVIRLLEGQPEISNLSDLEGIVLIDELDIHLHPTWQKALPTLLSEIFPKIQFIASTHSPIPLLGAPKESIVLKVHQSSEAGITVERLDIDVTQLLPNSLLTSPIFDFEEIIPIANASPKDLLTEDSFQEAMANEEIKERLKKIAQSLQ